MVASFIPVFLGDVDRLIPIMQESFYELGLKREECVETTWVNAGMLVAGFPLGQSLEILLDRKYQNPGFFKANSDYFQELIPESEFEGLWKRFYESDKRLAFLLMIPYGGKMIEISETTTPFPNRAGYVYKVIYGIMCSEEGDEASEKRINWTRRLYKYLTPYASKNPRHAYVNYRDLDIGVNNDEGSTSYKQASKWSTKYLRIISTD